MLNSPCKVELYLDPLSKRICPIFPDCNDQEENHARISTIYLHHHYQGQ